MSLDTSEINPDVTCCKKRLSTTLDKTIVLRRCGNEGTVGTFYKLKHGKGEKVVVRESLACQKRCHKSTPLASFVQITDVHIIDAASPARAAFLAQYIPDNAELQDAFRPQEALTLQVVNAMVRRINGVEVGPHTCKPFSLVVCTGDNGDGMQKNELQNYVNVLDGTKVYPNPATPGKYVGVQDNYPSSNYDAFWHPDCPPEGQQPDLYKVEYGFPDYPGLLDAAARPFKATGLHVPWYTCNGNHDCTKLGNYSLGLFSIRKLFNEWATGTLPAGVPGLPGQAISLQLPEPLGSKLVQSMSVPQALEFVRFLELQDASGIFDVIATSELRDIPKSSKRIQYDSAEFITTHFNTTQFPGPIGHGFSSENIQLNTLYYTFKVSDEIDGIMLDTCNPSGNLIDPIQAPDGSIGSIQLAWLEEELRKRHSTYLNSQGQIVRTCNKNKLVMLFSHHTSSTMENIFNSPTTFDNDPIKTPGPEFIKAMHRYPNIIAWVNGHMHRNRILPLKVKCPENYCRLEKDYYTSSSSSSSDTCTTSSPSSDTCTSSSSDSCTSSSSSSNTCTSSESYERHGCRYDGYTGFWEITTASHIDYPQQARIIEVANNNNGTLSIYGTIIDHLSPPAVKRSHGGCCGNVCERKCNKYSLTDMASISRELSANDVFVNPLPRVGKPKDRNVELIINNPLLRNW